MNEQFLEGYTGQSVDELLALKSTHRVDSIVLAFEEALDRKADAAGADSLSGTERIVLAVESLEREVNNGGFEQFFLNRPEYAASVVGSLRAIGCGAAAGITERAIEALNVAALDAESVEAAVDRENDARDEVLDACDSEFYEYPDPIDQRLFSYIEEHRDEVSFA